MESIRSLKLPPNLLFIGILGVLFLVIDPLANHSFTAPKNTLFILGSSFLFLLLIALKQNIAIGWVSVLFIGRIAWLAFTNNSWVIHPSNNGFLISIGLLIVLIISNSTRSNKNASGFFIALFLIGIIESILGTWQILSYIPNPSIPLKTPFVGTFGTSNGLGIFLVISFLCGLYLVIKKKNTALSVIGCLIILAGIFLSESRGSLLALIASFSFVAFLVFLKHTNKGCRIVAFISMLIISITSSFFLYNLDTKSSSGRWMIWEITANMIQENPWRGVGQGNYSRDYLSYQASYFQDPDHINFVDKAANIKQAHNEFLQSFAEGGVISGILFISIWFIPLVQMSRKLQKLNVLDPLLLVQLGIHCAIIIHSLLDSPLHVLPIAIIGYVNIGFVEKRVHSISLKKKERVFFGLVTLLFSGFICIKMLSSYPGYHYWKQGADHVILKEWKAAINDLKKAEIHLPKKGELLYQLGAVYIFDTQYSRGLYYINESKKSFNDRNIYLAESYGYLQLENLEQAERSAKRALEMFPTHLAPHLILGEIYFEQGKIEESRQAILKCIIEDISITSNETRQISEDAKQFWRQKFGRLPDYE